MCTVRSVAFALLVGVFQGVDAFSPRFLASNRVSISGRGLALQAVVHTVSAELSQLRAHFIAVGGKRCPLSSLDSQNTNQRSQFQNQTEFLYANNVLFLCCARAFDATAAELIPSRARAFLVRMFLTLTFAKRALLLKTNLSWLEELSFLSLRGKYL